RLARAAGASLLVGPTPTRARAPVRLPRMSLQPSRRYLAKVARRLALAAGAVFVGCCDRGRNAAARGEVADHGQSPGTAGGDQIVEDLIGHRFVENALLPEIDEVVLQ